MTAGIEAIGPDDELYRRLAPGQVADDGTVKSNAFKVRGKPADRISVDIARLRRGPEETLRGYEERGFGLAVLRASDLFGLDLELLHDPLDDNYAHAVVVGCGTIRMAREMARLARVLIMPRSE